MELLFTSLIKKNSIQRNVLEDVVHQPFELFAEKLFKIIHETVEKNFPVVIWKKSFKQLLQWRLKTSTYSWLYSSHDSKICRHWRGSRTYKPQVLACILLCIPWCWRTCCHRVLWNIRHVNRERRPNQLRTCWHCQIHESAKQETDRPFHTFRRCQVVLWKFQIAFGSCFWTWWQFSAFLSFSDHKSWHCWSSIWCWTVHYYRFD